MIADQAVGGVVDHPTQLICILIFICYQHTKKKDIAGQSAIGGEDDDRDDDDDHGPA